MVPGPEADGQMVGGGVGEALEGADLTVLRVAIVGPPTRQRLHRAPQCSGTHLAPFTGTVPTRTGTGLSPQGGGTEGEGRGLLFPKQPALPRLDGHTWGLRHRERDRRREMKLEDSNLPHKCSLSCCELITLRVIFQ